MLRTVRHLRLRARDEAEVRGTARRLEDALRCASLPDQGGRLLLVRRLDLGRVPADISSQGLALLVERRVRESGYTWVHGAAAGAADANANAVWFHDTAEALITLARHVMRRTPLAGAWFWRSVLPNYSAALAPARILEMIVAHAAAQPAGGMAVAQLVAALAQVVAPEALVTIFTPAAQRELQVIARQLGMPARRKQGVASEGDADSWVAPQGDAVRLTDSVQSIAPWLPSLLAAAGWREAPRVIADGRRRPDHDARTARAGAVTGHDALPTTKPGAPGTQEQATSPDAAAAPRAQPSTQSREPPHEVPAAPHDETAAATKPRIEEAISTPTLGEMFASRAAGLLFLLPLLGRLGFDEWRAALPPPQAQAVAIGVLRKALRRLRVDAEDPAYAMLAAWPSESVPCHSIDPPKIWRDPRIALQMPGAPDSDALAALWLTACRRSLRHAARIGLASLVLRPGAFAWSLTHLDAYFDLRDIDLRVRRNALDIDPGWLPWLGRVVSFHYEPGLRA